MSEKHQNEETVSFHQYVTRSVDDIVESPWKLQENSKKKAVVPNNGGAKRSWQKIYYHNACCGICTLNPVCWVPVGP